MLNLVGEIININLNYLKSSLKEYFKYYSNEIAVLSFISAFLLAIFDIRLLFERNFLIFMGIVILILILVSIHFNSWQKNNFFTIEVNMSFPFD